MTNLLLLGICLVIGLLFQQLKNLPKDMHQAINIIILYVPLPALALLSIPELEWRLDLFSLCLVPWFLFIVAFFLFRFLGKQFDWSHSVIGCLILTAGLGNTAFVGYPVIEALFGKEALKYAVFLDQPGTFLVVSSLGVWVAAFYSSGNLRKRDLARKIITFPPFVGFIVSLSLGLWGWRAEGDIRVILERLGSILTPLALISVGLQLKLREIKYDLKFLLFGLGYRLVIAPGMIFLLYRTLGIQGLIFKVAVLEAGMAPMITASILAQVYGLHPRLAGSIVGIGVPLSFVTVGMWYWFVS